MLNAREGRKTSIPLIRMYILLVRTISVGFSNTLQKENWQKPYLENQKGGLGTLAGEKETGGTGEEAVLPMGVKDFTQRKEKPWPLLGLSTPHGGVHLPLLINF